MATTGIKRLDTLMVKVVKSGIGGGLLLPRLLQPDYSGGLCGDDNVTG